MHDTCPKCKSNKLDVISLPCQNCISGVKKEILNLMKILTGDLQIDSESIRTTFSGNEGFHVYVSNSSYNQLGSNERRDLIDYIKFQSAIPERFGFNKKNDPSRSSFPDLGDPGWSGRVAKELFGSKSKRSKAIIFVILHRIVIIL